MSSCFICRYHRTISVSELYRLKDVINIEEQGNTGRTVSLVPGATSSPDRQSSDNFEVSFTNTELEELNVSFGKIII